MFSICVVHVERKSVIRLQHFGLGFKLQLVLVGLYQTDIVIIILPSASPKAFETIPEYYH